MGLLYVNSVAYGGVLCVCGYRWFVNSLFVWLCWGCDFGRKCDGSLFGVVSLWVGLIGYCYGLVVGGCVGLLGFRFWFGFCLLCCGIGFWLFIICFVF